MSCRASQALSADPVDNAGAYRLHIHLLRSAWITAGVLGRFRLERGHYVYVGSARRYLAQRIERHRQVASGKRCGGHWHIDGLLGHRYARLADVDVLSGARECHVSQCLAAQGDTQVPVAGFGATDCRSGCPAHLYRVVDACGR